MGARRFSSVSSGSTPLKRLERRERTKQRSGVIGVFSLALCSVLLLSSSVPANAAQAPVTIEQHFELLSEVSMGNVADATLPIARGTLPGGTSAFDPAPTVSFEVTGRHNGGAGSGSTWTVALKDSTGAQVAAVVFPKASYYALRTVAFTWPSADRDLDAITITRTNQGGVAGTFDLTKAYLKIHQQGLIKKTVGRVPLGTKQLGISSPSGSRLQGPALFIYHAGAFDPAPTVTLRATAQGNPCLQMYLHDDDDAANPIVTGSNLTFSSYRNAESPALTLTDGHQYVLHAAFSSDPSCLPSFGAGHGAAQVPNPSPPGTGDVFSADLTFSQSTTDANGLTKTVGWYPSVTAATDIATNADLNFMLNAPAATVPNAIAANWEYTAKRTSLSGSVGVAAVDRSNSDSVLANPPYVSGGSAFSRQFAAIPSLPSAGADLDSQGYVDNLTTTTGRISASLLALSLDLRDRVGPVLSGAFTSSRASFSPGTINPGAYHTVNFAGAFTDFSSVSWTITITGPGTSTNVVKTFTGSTKTVAATWDGRDPNDSNAFLTGDGSTGSTYHATLTAEDGATNPAASITPVNIAVDTVAPTAWVTSSQSLIGANADAPQNSTTFTGTVSADAPNWIFTLAKAPDPAVRLATGTTGSPTVVVGVDPLTRTL